MFTHTKYNQDHKFSVGDLICFNERADLSDQDKRWAELKVLAVLDHGKRIQVHFVEPKLHKGSFTMSRERYHVLSPYGTKNADFKGLLHKK